MPWRIKVSVRYCKQLKPAFKKKCDGCYSLQNNQQTFRQVQKNNQQMFRQVRKNNQQTFCQVRKNIFFWPPFVLRLHFRHARNLNQAHGTCHVYLYVTPSPHYSNEQHVTPQSNNDRSYHKCTVHMTISCSLLLLVNMVSFSFHPNPVWSLFIFTLPSTTAGLY